VVSRYYILSRSEYPCATSTNRDTVSAVRPAIGARVRPTGWLAHDGAAGDGAIPACTSCGHVSTRGEGQAGALGLRICTSCGLRLRVFWPSESRWKVMPWA
jgi:hypothetical protein